MRKGKKWWRRKVWNSSGVIRQIPIDSEQQAMNAFFRAYAKRTERLLDVSRVHRDFLLEGENRGNT